MNPAKAAPSAPVKKAAREDPQILPGGLLILFFFFYLRWVRQFSAIPTTFLGRKYGLQAADFQDDAVWGVIWLADK